MSSEHSLSNVNSEYNQTVTVVPNNAQICITGNGSNLNSYRSFYLKNKPYAFYPITSTNLKLLAKFINKQYTVQRDTQTDNQTHIHQHKYRKKIYTVHRITFGYIFVFIR